MKIATNPLSQDEQFLIEANNALVGQTISEIFPEQPPESVPDERVECVDVVGNDQVLLVLEGEEPNGLNHQITVDRDALPV
jgi:hypothetical protein